MDREEYGLWMFMAGSTIAFVVSMLGATASTDDWGWLAIAVPAAVLGSVFWGLRMAYLKGEKRGREEA